MVFNGGNPGKMAEVNYGKDSDRYGIGQFPNGAMRMYTATAFPGTVNLSLAKDNNTFDDAVQLTQTNVKINKPVKILGNLELCDTSGNNCRILNNTSKPVNGKYAPLNWGYYIDGEGHDQFKTMYGPISITTPSSGYLVVTWSGHTNIANPDWASYYSIFIDGKNPNSSADMYNSFENPNINMGAPHMYIGRNWYALNVTVHAKVGAGKHTLTPVAAIGAGQRVDVNGSAVSWTFIPE
jgi:hypothetical protein